MRDGRQASALVRMVRGRGLVGDKGAFQIEGRRVKDMEALNLACSGKWRKTNVAGG